MKVICSSTHECNEKENCCHAKPHEHKKNCGKGFYQCRDSKLISGCIPVENGQYKTTEREWCDHCKGVGFHDREIIHKIKEEIMTKPELQRIALKLYNKGFFDNDYIRYCEAMHSATKTEIKQCCDYMDELCKIGKTEYKKKYLIK